MIGIESRPLARFGSVPADGPEQWTSGTLFPQASKKVARAINAASGRRPLVVLANLAGFDGSPESMRRLQLEYGAEIGRAIVNFDGPIVFSVISRFHGGAFVVFSRRLNPSLETIALEGSHASVIGGAPAAAVVFAREVDNRTREDERIDDGRRRGALRRGPVREAGRAGRRVRRHPQRRARRRGRLRRPHHPGRRAATAADRGGRARDRASGRHGRSARGGHLSSFSRRPAGRRDGARSARRRRARSGRGPSRCRRRGRCRPSPCRRRLGCTTGCG